MSARGRVAGVMALALGLAGLLTASGARLAASQNATLTAMQTSEEVPAKEPFDPFWNRVPRIDVPLSAQQVTPPMGGRGGTLRARAVQDDERLYVMVEWPDSSPERSVGAPQDFTDAVAVQFPAVAGRQVPAFCMGDPTAAVNVWQWRAAWQADVHRGFQGDVKDRYPNTAVDWYPFHGEDLFYPGRYVGNPFSETDRTSPVDNLVATGFGSLTADPTPLVNGWGAWRDGTWRVVFDRPLQVGRDGNVELAADDWTDVAFAVWDGAAQERNGTKSVGNFVTLHLSSAQAGSVSTFPFWPLPFFVFVGAWGLLVWAVAAREARRDRG